MRRLELRPIVIALVAAFALAGSVIAPAQAAPATALSIRSSVSEVTAVQQANVACAAGRSNFSRNESCIVQEAIGYVFNGARLVGLFSFNVTHQMKLNTKSLKWSETIKITDVHLYRDANGIRVGLAATCGGTCTTVNRFPQQRVLGARDISGKVYYTETVAKHQRDTTNASYTLTFTKPGGYSIDQSTYASESFRCDDTFWSRDNTRRTQRAGCVFPAYTPTLMTMKSLKWIATNIRTVQARGGYGRQGSGLPLHREADRTKADANRRAVCGGQAPPAPNLSCDEYPFATTKEGGTALPASSRGIAWVPADEQDAQGGRINAFQKQQRLLDNDAFWVQV
ncbi:NucA/NucB deoxyribonuclease domain-containing protein [Streptomyces sp. TLI_146]|uniref:NucA/NucB deoxyribonuclease domain-containing protein n=1 Tax=Streptomyces sp. TLI_146 TaxID=1938858 RepID=UPI000CB44E99|nr:NucA/NucB deoxyribonuclease domain-containing protein [Streptomyces sp. TLI_146]PKV82758.1 deoxyribonuclease NucA/NucB [Streptomyces sp. TLI_146]